ncbi:MAG: protein kinase domain-containing protein [Myxococcales bacterium]
MRELAPGSDFGDWRIDHLIGRGGMGIVYQATDRRLGRPVAIKLIADDRSGDPSFRERFEREAQLTAAIDHPNVIPVYAAGEIDGQLYLATRFVDGTDLHKLLREKGPLPPERAADIARQVAEALDAAHAAGLVHRDVKPANVLLSGRHTYLSDFGLTRSVEAEAQLTDTDERLGTVDFMSPEQLRGQRLDARSDVYALGCLLFTVLTGSPPFHRPTAAATITAHLESPPPLASRVVGVPDEFDEVIRRALEKDAELRFQSAGDLGRAAVAAAEGQTTRDLGHSVARGEAAPLAETRKLDATGATAATRTVDETRASALPPTVAIKQQKRRNVLIEAVVIGAFLVVAAVVLVIALTGGSDDPNRPLSDSDVEAAAAGFARAYSHEDARAMARLLSPDVERVSASDVQRGRSSVLAAYRSQFRSQVTRDYKLDGLQVESGPAGRAEATFRVERAGRPPITGNVVLGIERRNGHARIRLIATESRT